MTAVSICWLNCSILIGKCWKVRLYRRARRHSFRGGEKGWRLIMRVEHSRRGGWGLDRYGACAYSIHRELAIEQGYARMAHCVTARWRNFSHYCCPLRQYDVFWAQRSTDRCVDTTQCTQARVYSARGKCIVRHWTSREASLRHSSGWGTWSVSPQYRDLRTRAIGYTWAGCRLGRCVASILQSESICIDTNLMDMKIYYIEIHTRIINNIRTEKTTKHNWMLF